MSWMAPFCTVTLLWICEIHHCYFPQPPSSHSLDKWISLEPPTEFINLMLGGHWLCLNAVNNDVFPSVPLDPLINTGPFISTRWAPHPPYVIFHWSNFHSWHHPFEPSFWTMSPNVSTLSSKLCSIANCSTKILNVYDNFPILHFYPHRIHPRACLLIYIMESQ